MEGSGTGGSVSPTLAAPAEPPTLLAPGEVIKPSGKFPKPTKIPGKNYSKDEVVIRNADSGKGTLNLQINVPFCTSLWIDKSECNDKRNDKTNYVFCDMVFCIAQYLIGILLRVICNGFNCCM